MNADPVRPSSPAPHAADVMDATYHPPYALTSDVVLSEDHYLLTLHQIDPVNDIVMAYSRVDGEVEAMVLQPKAADRGVLQVFRDPTATGGWNSRAIPNSEGATDMVAGMAAPTAWNDASGPKQLHVWFRQGEQVLHCTQDGQGNWTSVGEDLLWPSSASPLQLSYVATGDLLAYCFTDASSIGKTDARLFYDVSKTMHSAQHNSDFRATGSITGFEFHNELWGTLTIGGFATFQVADWTSAGRPGKGALLDIWVPTLDCGAVAVAAGGQAGVLHWNFPAFEPDQLGGNAVAGSDGLAQLKMPLDANDYVVSVDYALVTDQLRRLAVLRTASQKLLVLTFNEYTPQRTWNVAPIPVPTSVSAQPFMRWESALAPSQSVSPAQLRVPLLELFVQAGDVAYVIRPFDQQDYEKNTMSPQFYPPVPLQSGVAVVASQAAPSQGNELIVVSADGNLQYLVRDPVSGSWTGSDIQLPASDPLQVSTYRVRLSLVDNWGGPVSGANLSVSTHATQATDASGNPVSIQASPATALVNGQAHVLTGTPTVVTTAADGTVILALVATGTSAPPLSITTASAPAPLIVYPSGPVNAYLGGSGSLNMLPQMSSDTLKTATNSSNQPLAPGASKTTNGSSNADQAVKVLQGAAVAAAPSAPLGAGRRVSASLGARPAGLRHTITVGGVEVTLAGLADDILHGIKTGASSVQFVDIVRDVVTLVGDFAEAAYTFTVRTIEEAAHAFHSVINFLEAKISEFIDWLKAQILAVLADAVEVAKTFSGYIADDLCSAARAWVARGQGGTDAWFQQQETNIKNAFGNLADQLKGTTLTGLKASATPQAAGSPPAALGVSADPSSTTSGGHGQWLLDKIRSLAPDIDGTVAIPDDLEQKLAEVRAKFGTAGSDLATAGAGVAEDIIKAFSNPQDLLSTALPDIITKIGQLIAALVEVAQDVVDGAFALLDVLFEMWHSILTANMTQLPLIGGLIASLDPALSQLTVAQFGSLIVAFPFVITWKLQHSGQPVPFTSPAATRAALGASRHSRPQAPGVAPVGDAWSIMAGIATMINGGNAFFAASFSVPTPEGKADFPPLLCGVVDIVTHALVAVCSYPGAADREDLGRARPDFTDEAFRMSFVSWILASTLPSLIMTFSLAAQRGSNPVLKGVSGTLTNGASCFAALCATVLGAVSCHLSNQKDGKIWAQQFTGNLGAISYCLLLQPFQDSPVWGTMAQLACMGANLIGGVVTAILMFASVPY